MILDGSKRQTIRARRKHPPRQGQTAYLYTGMRTKNCKKLGEFPINLARSVVITKQEIVIYSRTLDDIELMIANENPSYSYLPPSVSLKDLIDEFAYDDGFRPDGTTRKEPKGSFELMIRFWSQTHSLPFAGDLITW